VLRRVADGSDAGSGDGDEVDHLHIADGVDDDRDDACHRLSGTGPGLDDHGHRALTSTPAPEGSRQPAEVVIKRSLVPPGTTVQVSCRA
jgi:hypothetical protein